MITTTKLVAATCILAFMPVMAMVPFYSTEPATDKPAFNKHPPVTVESDCYLCEIRNVATYPSWSRSRETPGTEMYVYWSQTGNMDINDINAFDIFLMRYGTILQQLDVYMINNLRYYLLPETLELGPGYQIKVEYVNDRGVYNFSRVFTVMDDWGFTNETEEMPDYITGPADITYNTTGNVQDGTRVDFFKRIITTFTELWFDVVFTNLLGTTVNRGAELRVHAGFTLKYANNTSIAPNETDGDENVFLIEDLPLEYKQERRIRLVLQPTAFIGTVMLAFSQKITVIPVHDGELLENDVVEEYFVCFKSEQIQVSSKDFKHETDPCYCSGGPCKCSFGFWLKSWLTTDDPSWFKCEIVNRLGSSAGWQVWLKTPCIAPFAIQDAVVDGNDSTFVTNKVFDQTVYYGGSAYFERDIEYSATSPPDFDFVRYPVSVLKETASFGVENYANTFVDVYYNGFGDLGADPYEIVENSDIYFDEEKNQFHVTVKMSQPNQSVWIRTENTEPIKLDDQGDGNYGLVLETENWTSMAERFNIEAIGEGVSLAYEVMSIATLIVPETHLLTATVIVGILDLLLNSPMPAWIPGYDITAVLAIIGFASIVMAWKMARPARKGKARP